MRGAQCQCRPTGVVARVVAGVGVPERVVGAETEQLLVANDAAVVETDAAGPAHLGLRDRRLEATTGVGEPVGHLRDRHAGVRGQRHLLRLRRVRVGAVTAEPALEGPRHVLQRLPLLVYLARHRASETTDGFC